MHFNSSTIVISPFLIQLIHNLDIIDINIPYFKLLNLFNESKNISTILNQVFGELNIYEKLGHGEMLQSLISPFMEQSKICLNKYIETGIYKQDEMMAKMVWYSSSETELFECSSSLKFNVSFIQGQRFFLFSRRLAQLPDIYLTRTCTLLLRLFTPFIFGSFSSNTAFKNELKDFCLCIYC